MKMWLNCGSNDVDDLEFEKDTDFGFTVEFDNGERVEITYEPDIAKGDEKMVTCSMFNKNDTLLQRRVVRN